jgi:hypothetical protein
MTNPITECDRVRSYAVPDPPYLRRGVSVAAYPAHE